MNRRRLVPLALVLVLFAVACGGDDSGGADSGGGPADAGEAGSPDEATDTSDDAGEDASDDLSTDFGEDVSDEAGDPVGDDVGDDFSDDFSDAFGDIGEPVHPQDAVLGYGDGTAPGLDDLALDCFLGVMASCDQLFADAVEGSDHRAFGDSCAYRQATGTGVSCVDAFG